MVIMIEKEHKTYNLTTSMDSRSVDCLDHGFVRLLDHMGSDLTVVNSARVSFNKQSTEVTEKDIGLIKYLAKHEHWTPFAHPQVSFHVKAPIFVRTQMFKSKVGLVENEISRRYIDFEPDFFVPSFWRSRPEGSIKQGSGSKEIEDVEDVEYIYKAAIDIAKEAYKVSITEGLAPELARGLLPQCMYTEWHWTGSLAAFARVVAQRSSSNAQEETQQFAFAIDTIMSELFPISWEALTK